MWNRVKIAYFVELNISYQPAKFHWPRLSESNFTKGGWGHPFRLTRSKKPSPCTINAHQYNVCSVHRGMFSASEVVQYIGRMPEYIGGIS